MRGSRSLLVLVLALIVTLACSPTPEFVVDPVANEVTKVIVVGAGASGLTAARALHDSGIETVVLEARDRVGGRTHTAQIDGATVDLGGAWIHGAKDNPAARMADALGVSYSEHDYDYDVVHDEVLGRLGPAQTAQTFASGASYLERIWDLAETLDTDISVTEAMDQLLAADAVTGDDARLARFVVEQAVFELDLSGPADNSSVIATLDEPELSGDDDQIVQGGYASLIDPLAAGLDIRLGDAVTQISYDAQGVEVRTASGEVYAGSHVVVTVPLGVLKAGAISFEPPLPSAKLAAIERMDMGNLEKVVLRFDEALWPDIAAGSGIYIDAQVEGQMPVFIDMSAFAGAPTLVGIYGGGYSRSVQASLSDEALVAEALAALEAILEVAAPEPRATHVTRWTTDPYSRGSYSYVAVGGSYADLDTLAAPVVDRVLFAGEATWRGAPSTVHGAMASGVREAVRLGAEASRVPGF